MGKILKNKTVLLAVGLAVVAGLFIVLKPDSAKPDQQNSQQNTQTSTPSSETKTFALKVEKDKTTGNTEMKATDGDTVVINIDSEVTDELHMHGYDKTVQLEPGEKYSLTFKADQTGRFEIELHELHEEIAVLEVQPRP